jgi:hypothetical protein
MKTLPKDLKNFAIKSVLKRMIPCVLLLTTFVILLIFWGDVILPVEKEAVKIIVYTMVMIVPFAVTGVPFKLIDQTYSGTVQKVKIATTIDNEYHGRPTREYLYTKNTVFLHVEKENGVVVRKKASESSAKLAQNLETYKVGDRVFHLYGSRQTVVLPTSSDKMVQCPVCGTNNDKTSSHCEDCGHSLVIG